MYRRIGYSLFFCLLFSCAVFKENRLPPKREFRGVWIATVANIDWPQSGLNTWEKQQDDFRKLLDFYEQLNFNAVIVQIRTAGDAFYPSKYAPWSRYLTGIEGEAPQTEDDPLRWMIAETHRHGMEFHAWMNPYRATFDKDTLALSPSHDFYNNRAWIIPYGNKNYYDPGNPDVTNHLVNIVAEVVENYAIDGIHFDDYFYPYRIKDETFNDSISFNHHNPDSISLAQWRRNNIDSLIANTSKTVKTIKPWVKFGVSPFGVWRNVGTDPRGSATTAGQTNFDDLYADPLTWLENDWLDYIVPQVYWSMDFPAASYRSLVHWWAGKVKTTPLFIGHAAYKIRNNADKAWKKKKELIRQLKLSRELSEVRGNVFYNATALYKKHPKVAKLLFRKHYKFPALTPPIINNGNTKPWKQPFTIHPIQSDTLSIMLSPGSLKAQRLLIFGAKKRKNLNTEDMRQLKVNLAIENKETIKVHRNSLGRSAYFAVMFLDRQGLESDTTLLTSDELYHYGAKR